MSATRAQYIKNTTKRLLGSYYTMVVVSGRGEGVGMAAGRFVRETVGMAVGCTRDGARWDDGVVGKNKN